MHSWPGQGNREVLGDTAPGPTGVGCHSTPGNCCDSGLWSTFKTWPHRLAILPTYQVAVCEGQVLDFHQVVSLDKVGEHLQCAVREGSGLCLDLVLTSTGCIVMCPDGSVSTPYTNQGTRVEASLAHLQARRFRDADGRCDAPSVRPVRKCEIGFLVENYIVGCHKEGLRSRPEWPVSHC